MNAIVVPSFVTLALCQLGYVSAMLEALAVRTVPSGNPPTHSSRIWVAFLETHMAPLLPNLPYTIVANYVSAAIIAASRH
jgi:hypothetical protein